MDKNYGGVIWTNHAINRLNERGISQSDALYTFQKPQQSRYGESQGAWIYYRTYGNQRVEVVAKQNEKKEWIILSVWSKLLDSNFKHDKVHKKQSIFIKFLRFIIGAN